MTPTGRNTQDTPNMQSIPLRTPEAARVIAAFRPPLPPAPPTVYARLLAAGVSMSNWQSDLYVAITPESTEIVNDELRKGNMCRPSVFRNRVTGAMNYEINFAFDPFWDRRKPVTPAVGDAS